LGHRAAYRSLEQLEIVLSAFTLRYRNYLSGSAISDYLRFDCVPLFLARIVLSLFFWGLSIVLSVTSTKITLIPVLIFSFPYGRYITSF
jgi:hypothetical protein